MVSHFPPGQKATSLTSLQDPTWLGPAKPHSPSPTLPSLQFLEWAKIFPFRAFPRAAPSALKITPYFTWHPRLPSSNLSLNLIFAKKKKEKKKSCFEHPLPHLQCAPWLSQETGSSGIRPAVPPERTQTSREQEQADFLIHPRGSHTYVPVEGKILQNTSLCFLYLKTLPITSFIH